MMNYLAIRNLMCRADEIPSHIHYPPIKAGAHKVQAAILILLFCFSSFVNPGTRRSSAAMREVAVDIL